MVPALLHTHVDTSAYTQTNTYANTTNAQILVYTNTDIYTLVHRRRMILTIETGSLVCIMLRVHFYIPF